MKTVKRLEIVIDSIHSEEIFEVLDQHGIKQYNRIKEIWGKGDQWDGSDGFLSEAFHQEYILAVCPLETIDTLTEALKPLITRYNGLLLLTDATTLA